MGIIFDFAFSVFLVVFVVVKSVSGESSLNKKGGVNYKLLIASLIFSLLTIAVWGKRFEMDIFMGTNTILLWWIFIRKVRMVNRDVISENKEEHFGCVNIGADFIRNNYNDVDNKFGVCTNTILNVPTRVNCNTKAPNDTTQVISNKYIIIGKNIYIQADSISQVLNNNSDCK